MIDEVSVEQDKSKVMTPQPNFFRKYRKQLMISGVVFASVMTIIILVLIVSSRSGNADINTTQVTDTQVQDIAAQSYSFAEDVLAGKIQGLDKDISEDVNFTSLDASCCSDKK